MNTEINVEYISRGYTEKKAFLDKVKSTWSNLSPRMQNAVIGAGTAGLGSSIYGFAKNPNNRLKSALNYGVIGGSIGAGLGYASPLTDGQDILVQSSSLPTSEARQKYQAKDMSPAYNINKDYDVNVAGRAYRSGKYSKRNKNYESTMAARSYDLFRNKQDLMSRLRHGYSDWFGQPQNYSNAYKRLLEYFAQ